jgi:hypothetical protein
LFRRSELSAGQLEDECGLILGMQTLGISDSTSRSESRLKSLFWPSIESGADVDYLAIQGYWVCTVVALLSFAVLFMAHQPILAVVTLLFIHLGGVGVREHSLLAATVVFVYYVIDMLASYKLLLASPGTIVLRAIITALLLSNLRASWIAAHWQSGSDEAAMPLRLDDTFTDKFANKWPIWLWPKIRVVYYIFSVSWLLLIGIGLAVLALRRGRG